MQTIREANRKLIVATFNHRDGYQFNVCYRTKGDFLRAVTRSKTATLDNAVDGTKVIRSTNIQQYREGKLK